MIEEQAVVIAIDSGPVGNRPLVTLEISRQTPCGICGQTRGCGNSLWGKIFAHKSSAFIVDNSINAQLGDNVIVGMDEQVILKSALLMYALPLATMMLGVLLGSAIISKNPNQADLHAVIGAVAGLALGFFWVKGHTASTKYNLQNSPIILRLANPANSKFKFD